MNLEVQNILKHNIIIKYIKLKCHIMALSAFVVVFLLVKIGKNPTRLNTSISKIKTTSIKLRIEFGCVQDLKIHLKLPIRHEHGGEYEKCFRPTMLTENRGDSSLTVS